MFQMLNSFAPFVVSVSDTLNIFLLRWKKIEKFLSRRKSEKIANQNENAFTFHVEPIIVTPLRGLSFHFVCHRQNLR